MKRLFSFILLTVLLGLGFSQNTTITRASLLKEYQSANSIVTKADKLTDAAGENEELLAVADQTYEEAIQAFQQLIPGAVTTRYDSLLLFLHLQSAYLSFYLNKQEPAKSGYLQALTIKQQLPAVEDSFLFLPLVYTGGIYYNENKFDSALYYYKKAEKIADEYHNPLEESQRLYNRLGAMYYETGNYRQARNYFEKAIALLGTDKNVNKGLLVNYQVNIAAILVKLEEYKEAKALFEKVLQSGIYNNEVNHNLAIIYLKEENYQTALGYLRQVSYSNSKKNIELLYNKGMAWSGLQNRDSADHYLEKALAENQKWYGASRSISYGLILKYKAELAVRDEDFETALGFFQQAIIQFDNNFSATDSTRNPEHFSGVFSYINLFNTLAAKAAVFEKLYGKGKKITHLENALAAYQSAFQLADYVEKTYNTDEARLFLGKIKYTVHSRPIDISLHLFELTKDRKYLEAAWNFDQRNKASLLSLNLQEADWKNKLTDSNELIHQENTLKDAITRLLLKAQNETDNTRLAAYNNEIRDLEIGLGKIQDQITASPEMKIFGQGKDIPSISSMQKELDGSSAIISYHLSETKILIFCIAAGKVSYEYMTMEPSLKTNLRQYSDALQHTAPGQVFEGAAAAKELFRQLLKPVLYHVADLETLIIIPDDELHYLPFETLQDDNNEYLLNHFSFQYLYSASLFKKNNTHISYTGILGFAPFTAAGYTDSSDISLKQLPYSGQEITQPKASLFLDSAATKKNFLAFSNQYPVLHLATHAAVDNSNADRSYIAFYPKGGNFLLYAPEIYNLDLDSTQLVILSACETGTGQLIRGEGLMSLSRAFAYAGCSNIIASLWKAEDKTTSFITRQLYVYLNKGYSKAKALQKAKLDLLNSKEIAPALKAPNYWGHLVFIGDYETGSRSNYPTWLIMVASLFIALVIYFFQRKRPARDQQTAL